MSSIVVPDAINWAPQNYQMILNKQSTAINSRQLNPLEAVSHNQGIHTPLTGADILLQRMGNEIGQTGSIMQAIA